MTDEIIRGPIEGPIEEGPIEGPIEEIPPGDEIPPGFEGSEDDGLIENVSSVDVERFLRNHTLPLAWSDEHTQGTGLTTAHTPDWNQIAKRLHLASMRKVVVASGEIVDGRNPDVYRAPLAIKYKVARNAIGRQSEEILFNGALWRIAIGSGNDVKVFDFLQVSSWNDLANVCNVLTGGDTTIPVYAEIYLLEDNTKNGLAKIAHEGAIVTDIRGTGRWFNASYHAVRNPLGRYIGERNEFETMAFYQRLLRYAWPSVTFAWPLPPNPDIIARAVWITDRHIGNKQYSFRPGNRYNATGNRMIYAMDPGAFQSPPPGSSYRVATVRLARINLETLDIEHLDQNDHGVIGKLDYFRGNLSKYSYVFVESIEEVGNGEHIAVFVRPIGPDALLLPVEDWTRHKVIGIAKTTGQAPIMTVLPGRYGESPKGMTGSNAIVFPFAAIKRSARKPQNDGNDRGLPAIFFRTWETGTPFVGPESPFVIRHSIGHGKSRTSYFMVDYDG